MKWLERLERHTPGKLLGLFTNTETGEQRTIPLRDIHADNFTSWKLEKIVSGDSLRDLDKYLAAFRRFIEAGG